MIGWIKLHRKIVEWEWYSDIPVRLLFFHLLLTVNHEKKKWKGFDVMPGQIITGRKKLSEETGLSEMQVRSSLIKLKSTSEITIKPYNKFSVITVVSWHEYQQDNQQANQQVTNNQPTNNQQITTTQEYKNIRSKEEDTILTDSTSSQKDDKGSELKIDFDKILTFYNETCKRLRPAKVIAGKRRGLISARIREHGKQTVILMMQKVQASDYLSGQNKSGWQADIDWIFRPNNFTKIIEGKYDNSEQKNGADTIKRAPSREEVSASGGYGY